MTSHLSRLDDATLALPLTANPLPVLHELCRPGQRSWLDGSSPSGLFFLHVEGREISGRTPGLSAVTVAHVDITDGITDHTVSAIYRNDELSLRIEWHATVYSGTSVLEVWTRVENLGAASARVDRIDSVSLDLPADELRLLRYRSGWGTEFEPVDERLDEETTLGTTQGRSSNGMLPWFALVADDGRILAGSVMWSGNWIVRFEPLPTGGYRLSGGLHEEGFSKDLRAGQSMSGPHVALSLGANSDLDTVSIPLAGVGRRHWYPRNKLSDLLAVEWNHWSSYEDSRIDEETFKRNVDVAARLGVEVCTLDAGWFGPPDAGTHWFDYRGDWDQVNITRFPSGISALSDYVHAAGMRFGLWCEIEAVGSKADIGKQRPEMLATRGNERLGYVCLGSSQGQVWAFETLNHLIDCYRCDWIKLDFNLDPGLGCDRTDHGHGPGDGLYEHYAGYYRLLERVRSRHPEVLLENCSSGGLRIDLAIMRQTHTTYLSDPDWPEHDLQLFWGASTMLAPDRCLHWSWSEWIHQHPRQTFNPRDAGLTSRQLDYYTRISMLGGFGYSQRLPDLPSWVMQRLGEHTAFYKDVVRRFVRHAAVHRLTGQPLREGRGERWSAFQYSLAEQDEHLLFVFRLEGAQPDRTLLLHGLDRHRAYQVRWSTEARAEVHSGGELMVDGLPITGLQEEDSDILLLTPEPPSNA